MRVRVRVPVRVPVPMRVRGGAVLLLALPEGDARDGEVAAEALGHGADGTDRLCQVRVAEPLGCAVVVHAQLVGRLAAALGQPVVELRDAKRTGGQEWTESG